VTDKPQAEEEAPPDLEGPDPRTWRGSEKIWHPAEDFLAADEMLRLLSGEIAQDGMSGHYEEARALVRKIAATAREHLALAILEAYGALVLPEDEAPGRESPAA
jgi:hypothetical protein